MTIQRIFLLLVIYSVLLCSTHAVETSYFTPDLVGSSARSIRLGGIEGMSSHSDSVFENPAALYRVKRFSTTFFQTTFMEEVVYQNIAFAMKTNLGVFGLGFFNAGVDNIPKTMKNEYEDYTEYYVKYYFNYQNSLLKASYQVSPSEFLHLGISGSYFYNEFDTVKATGSNVDVGAVLDFERLNFSILVRNLMTSNEIRYVDSEIGSNSSNNQTEKLSIQNIYSVNYRLRHFTMYGQIKTVGSQRELHKALGLQFNPRFLPFLEISGGYKQYPQLSYEEGVLASKEKTSFAVGIGLDLWGLCLDYSYARSDHVSFDHNNYFSVGLSF